MKRARRLSLRLVAILLTLFAFYLFLLCFPQPLFNSSASSVNLTLYSDKPFPPGEGEKVLEIAEAKLSSSPLFSAQTHHSIFICNSRWRQVLFFNFKYGVGGVNYCPLTTNVFLSGARIEENRLISPSGNVVQGDRTLDYFITHEAAHTLVKQSTGWYRHLKLPEYVSEGYPDYLARGKSFDYEKAKLAFLSEAPEMDRWGSGLYLRYHLLVAFLLDKKRWGIEQLLEHPMEQKAVEEEIRGKDLENKSE